MKSFHIVVCLALVILLVWLVPGGGPTLGGLSWIGWASMTIVIFLVGFIVIVNDSARAAGFFKKRAHIAVRPEAVRTLSPDELAELKLDKYRGPAYPHPVIFPDRCIGCQACVDACPHDVLDIIDGTAVAVAPDLCMEDTACQAECPVNPKACIVINTSKPVVSRPAPTRDGASYQTNVPGCYIIGDVSGVPLIKNAVKEGFEVISHIADDLKKAGDETKAEYDVAIIGVGPGGASAAASAKEMQLRYVAIEQDKVLSTIEAYPKGKYIFFKPDTKSWFGGLPAAGLGLSKSKYAASSGAENYTAIAEKLGADFELMVLQQSAMLSHELLPKIPASLRLELAPLLAEKIAIELHRRIVEHLLEKSSGDVVDAYRTVFVPRADELLSEFKREIVEQIVGRVPGDQRENILRVWLSSLDETGVKVNEFESCKSVKRADDGDYFVIETQQRESSAKQTYRARRVVIAIGLRGEPNRLRLPNEDLKITIDGREQPKVLYNLTNPADYRGKRIVVVGGGNVAVEAAVDLVANRIGSSIEPRPANEKNQVTLLVRTSLAPTVKFGNKYQLYQCADEGILDLRFGVAIKEMRERELGFEDVRTGAEVETIPNDFVFALIGGERPDRFLQSIGITLT